MRENILTLTYSLSLLCDRAAEEHYLFLTPHGSYSDDILLFPTHNDL